MMIPLTLTVLQGLALLSSTTAMTFDLSEKAESPHLRHRRSTEADAAKFVLEIESRLNDKCHENTKAQFDFVTNLTAENEAKATAATLDYSNFRKEYWKEFVAFPWKSFKEPTLKRQFFLESVLGLDILPEQRIREFTETMNAMKQMYSKAKICDFKDKTKCDLNLEPEITEKMASSRDYDELEHLWVSWHGASGGKMASLFQKYIEISNEGAVANGYHDMGELWRRPYQAELIHLEVWALWGQIRPLYEQIHAYARQRLRDFYKRDTITPTGLIPAHLFGNMWGQNWGSIYEDILVPYKDCPNLDVSAAMQEQNYTVLKMFQQSDDFFRSLGLLPMNDNFWKKSILQRPPPPTELVCHAEAWDLCNKEDFLIKQCTTVNMRDFITVHHEMGHIQYYMQYKDQLSTFREGANPGFHEAIGDTIAMSVSSPRHLQQVGLLPGYESSEKNVINHLMSQAVKMLIDIPWELVVEQWRWDVFSGKVTPPHYNQHWWTLRQEIQGLKPPRKRNASDFDPGAKYHIPNGVPYLRYFTARIMTYQFHESLCKAAGQFDANDPKKPLHECDIYKSKEAGSKLGAMLKLGSSKPWPEALELVTGSRRLDARPVLNYYAPLMKWLEAENKRTGQFIGWADTDESSYD